MKKVYVAGAISSPNLEQSLKNIRNGIEAGSILLQRGFAPYVPHLDFLYNLVQDDKIKVETYYKTDIEWLKTCDLMLVLPYYQDSKGVKKEIEVAKENKIPIYYSIITLLDIESEN